MTKRKPIGTALFTLVRGENNLLIQTGSALVDEIEFQTPCDAHVMRAFHGAQNLFGVNQSVSIFKKSGAGHLFLAPPEEFHDGLDTTFVVTTDAEKAPMIVNLYAPEDAMKVINGKPGFYKMKDPNKEAVVNISAKLRQAILRELGISKDDWKDFRIDVILKYVGDQPYVFSSISLSDEP